MSTHLQLLESEGIFVLREVVAEFDRPVLLFSGGKDSIVISHLAWKALWPGFIPFPLMHIDTGHNFPETLEYRGRMARKNRRTDNCEQRVEESIRQGRVTEQKGPGASRNALQSVTLLDAIREFRFDCAIGDAQRDEEKARAKEQFFSVRDEFGQWEPRNQRPESWSLYNGRRNPNEHFRVFPISNWTELGIWQDIEQEGSKLPCLYFAHERECVERDGTVLAKSGLYRPDARESATTSAAFAFARLAI